MRGTIVWAGLCVAGAVWMGGALPAQQGVLGSLQGSAQGSLQGLTQDSGPIVVWLVRPVERAQLPDQTLHTQTAGSYGTNASNYGTASSNVGQTAASYGQSASDVGTASSNVGQTAGSYGNSLSTIADAGATNARAADARADAALQRQRDPYREELRSQLQSAVPTLQPTFVAVPAEQLTARLLQVQGQAGYPDVVMGEPTLQPEARAALRGLVAATLGSAGLVPITEAAVPLVAPPADVELMLGGRHARAARSFLLALREGPWLRRDFAWTDDNRAPVQLAMNAVQSVLAGGQGITAADPELGGFSTSAARTRALEPQSVGGLNGLRAEVVPVASEQNERLALVRLFALVGSPQSFGAVHPVVVLRRRAGDNWRVLSITLNLAPQLGEQTQAVFARYTAPDNATPDHATPDNTTSAATASAARPMAVTELLPADGTEQQPPPQLGWQNNGGGSLLVIEWQLRTGASGAPEWTDSSLYFVPDDGGRLQTRAEGRFASAAGVYRWRVWTVAANGLLALSAWHTLRVGP